MESRYTDNTSVPAFDSRVTKLVEQSEDKFGGGGKPMDVGIENEQGDVYRKVRCWGMGEYIRFTQGMLDLGFEDALRNVTSQGGLDSRFVVTPEVLKGAEVCSSAFAEPSPLDDIEAAAVSLSELPETERSSVIKSRLGQGVFREQLIEYWEGCSITGAKCIRMLKASHIKPWRVATNAERLDAYNGLLLSPALDLAFDAGLITFEESGRIAIGPVLAGSAAYEFHISHKMRINPKKFRPEHKAYLKCHREQVFQRGE